MSLYTSLSFFVLQEPSMVLQLRFTVKLDYLTLTTAVAHSGKWARQFSTARATTHNSFCVEIVRHYSCRRNIGQAGWNMARTLELNVLSYSCERNNKKYLSHNSQTLKFCFIWTTAPLMPQFPALWWPQDSIASRELVPIAFWCVLSLVGRLRKEPNQFWSESKTFQLI